MKMKTNSYIKNLPKRKKIIADLTMNIFGKLRSKRKYEGGRV
jgi:hypothetical protein